MCIYIDPPYNTGNEGWTYNDNVNSPEIKQWLGKVVGREVEDLSRHDKWLCMMYPRLYLLRNFLSEDGVIFISIDDNGVASLRFLLEEIFGINNFISCLVWQKSKKGDSKFISVSHEYILIAVKNKSTLIKKGVKWRREKPGVDLVLSKYIELQNEFLNNHDLISKGMKAWYRSLPKNNPAKAHNDKNANQVRNSPPMEGAFIGCNKPT